VTGPGPDRHPAVDPSVEPSASGSPTASGSPAPSASVSGSLARGGFVSDRRYRFAADRWSVWTTIGSVQEYRAWWPWLRRFEANGLAVGDVWVCQIQPPVPYALRFTVVVEQVDAPSLVIATVDGDVRGTARLDLEDDDPADHLDAGPGNGPGNRPDEEMLGGGTRVGTGTPAGNGCRVRLRSTLVPANRTLRTVARLSRPVAQFGHAWVIDTGARQFGDRALSRP
jgi:hypothetical protein